MTDRFVLDEASWHFAPPDSEALSAALATLLERLDVAAALGESVNRHGDFYETRLGNGPPLFEAMFEPDCEVTFDRDLAERFRLAIDRARLIEDGELSELDATIAGTKHLAPGACWAHARNLQRHAVAVLPLPVHTSFTGQVEVVVGDHCRSIHFVTTEEQRRAFSRDTILIEDMGHEEFSAHASSAFPDLDWVDGVWHELRVYKKYFFGEHLATTVRHLSVLNDEGAQLFHTHPGGELVDRELDSRGVVASTENGRTRSYKPAVDCRTRTYNGANCVFWWHTKIQWDVGRIHFLHVPKKSGSKQPDYGHIVIGLFKDHCTLPD